MTWWYEDGLTILDYDKDKGWHYRHVKEKKMEFDKSRVYTALNADELKAGDKVIVADELANLKGEVANFCCSDELITVLPENNKDRFVIAGCGSSFALAYLVERKENCTNCACHCEVTAHPEIDRCENYKSKTEQKAEKYADYNCEEVRKAYDHAMTNACPEKHYRPFKDTDELIKVWDEKIGQWHDNLEMPYIWVRNKSDRKVWLINEFDNRILDYLFTNCEFLDGSPCGVEEQ